MLTGVGRSLGVEYEVFASAFCQTRLVILRSFAFFFGDDLNSIIDRTDLHRFVDVNKAVNDVFGEGGFQSAAVDTVLIQGVIYLKGERGISRWLFDFK